VYRTTSPPRIGVEHAVYLVFTVPIIAVVLVLWSSCWGCIYEVGLGRSVIPVGGSMYSQLSYPAPERWLRLSEVLFLTGLPRSTLYYQIQKGRFPRPQKKGRISLWRFSEVERYLLDPNRYTSSLYQK